MYRTFLLALALALPFGAIAAEDHLVPAPEIEQELADRAAERAADLAAVDGLFEHAETAETIEQAGFDPQQIRDAVPLLDDTTLADLAARARALDADDVEGGILGTLVLLLLLAILLVVLLTQLQD